MSKEGLTLSPLHEDDIEEKIRLNEAANISMDQLKFELTKEIKECIWMKIRLEVQIQNLTEQLEYINKRLFNDQ